MLAVTLRTFALVTSTIVIFSLLLTPSKVEALTQLGTGEEIVVAVSPDGAGVATTSADTGGAAQSLIGGRAELRETRPLTDSTRIIEVAPGDVFALPAGIAVDDVELELEGADLILILRSGSRITLLNFFQFGKFRPSLSLADGTILRSDQILDLLMPATAAGGAEIFGAVQVFSWLLDRLDLEPVSTARAAERPTTAIAVVPIERLLLQLKIDLYLELLRLTRDYEATTSKYVAALKERQEAGGGSVSDMALAELYHVKARLEVKEVNFRLGEANALYSGKFETRPKSATYPDWEKTLPGALETLMTKIAPDKRAIVLQYWRQKTFAESTKILLDKLVLLATQLVSRYRQEFDVAQRSLTELLSIEEILYQSRVQLTQRNFDVLTAKARLLEADGQLPLDPIRRHGKQ